MLVAFPIGKVPTVDHKGRPLHPHALGRVTIWKIDVSRSSFNQLRGVQFIVTAAVYWGFNSKRRLAANLSF
jgi:hypothetical protein